MGFERVYKVDVSSGDAVMICAANERRIALFASTPGGASLWAPNLPVFACSKGDADAGLGMELITFPTPGYQEFSPRGEIWFKPPFALPGAHLNIFERYE